MSLDSIFKAAQIVSFDVFDTLLLRNTKPEILRFKEIADLWAEETPESVTAADLFHSRLLAARISYRVISQRQGCREAGFAQILRTVCQLNELDESVIDVFRERELQYEIENLALHRKLATQLRQAMNEGKPVFAISDMYFSAIEIHRLIVAHVPEFSRVEVYSSSDQNLNKAGGELYKHISETRALTMDEHWLHVGDNYHSDVVNARRLGLSAQYIPRGHLWRAASHLRKIGASLSHKVGSL